MTVGVHPVAAAILEQAAAAGLSIEDLVRAARQTSPTPTVSEFRPRVQASASSGAVETYKTYWDDLEAALGDIQLGEITTTDLKLVAKDVKERARQKRPSNAGRGAEEHFVSAARLFFRTAVEDRLIDVDPTANLTKPRRGKGRRRPLNEGELFEVVRVTPVGSDDPELDQLLVRFHIETGARRAGALNLRLNDLAFSRQTVWLHEKYDAEREQPVTKGLLEELRRHALDRGDGDLMGPVFHYRRRPDGTAHPLTYRRYNTLFPRIQRLLSFSANTRVDAHTLRTTAIALVERVSSHEVARRFAGHAEGNVTSHYARASIEEVAAAISHLTGEPHPLAPR